MKTKYDIGDTVYLCMFGDVIPATITEIHIIKDCVSYITTKGTYDERFFYSDYKEAIQELYEEEMHRHDLTMNHLKEKYGPYKKK